MNGEAPNVRFVYYCLGPRMPEWLILTPIEGLIDEHAFWRRAGIVLRRKGQVLLGSLLGSLFVAECQLKIPRRQPGYRLSARVHKKLVEVETVPLFWFVRSIDTISIELTMFNPSEPNMPHVACSILPRIQIESP